MKIIITDLTRFANEDIVCIAGINPETNECIRPLPYLTRRECERLNILPGAIIEGNFIPRECSAPHSEDRGYSGRLTYRGPCSSEEFRSILHTTESFSVEEGFSVDLDFGQKHIPSESPPDISIITLALDPNNLDIVQDAYKKGKIKVIFTDNAEKSYRYLAITDLGFFNYAEKYAQTNKIDDLNDFIHSQKEVLIRIGLGREYEAKDGSGRKGFWLQVNGIYTFPEFFKDIRSYN